MAWAANIFWYNLKTGFAFKSVAYNMKRLGVWGWFLNELAPAGYTNAFQHPTFMQYFKEGVGWSDHVAIGYMAVHYFGGSPLTVGLIALAVEIIQFVAAEGKYVNPLNSAIDIAFYVLGARL